MQNYARSNSRTQFLFLVAVVILSGFYLSEASFHRFFWTDEAISTSIAMRIPWTEYLVGHSGEGNTSPLFFLILRVLLHIQPFLTRHGFDPIICLRLIGLIPMTLTCALLVEQAMRSVPRSRILFASSFFVAVLGMYAVREYGWQSRHYSLWVLLTLFFTKFLFEEAEKPHEPLKKSSCILILTSLCLTTSFGIFQLLGGALFFLLSGVPKQKIFSLIGVGLAPAFYALYCRSNGFNPTFIWTGISGFQSLILANAKWWLILSFVPLFNLLRNEKAAFKIVCSFLASLGVLCLFLILLFWFNRNPRGFELPNRYFLFLFPQLAFAFLWSIKLVTSQKVSNYLIWCTSALLIAAGVPGILAMKRSWESPHFSRVEESEISKIYGILGKNCACLELPNIPEHAKWVTQYLYIRSRNIQKHCQKPPVFLTFAETAMSQNIVEPIFLKQRSNKELLDEQLFCSQSF